MDNNSAAVFLPLAFSRKLIEKGAEVLVRLHADLFASFNDRYTPKMVGSLGLDCPLP